MIEIKMMTINVIIIYNNRNLYQVRDYHKVINIVIENSHLDRNLILFRIKIIKNKYSIEINP